MSTDLFELAEDLARLIDAPITIEDTDTVVIAYGGEHQDVDRARVETILNRQVPVRYREAIADAGIFERLRATDEVVLVDLPRARMATRAVVALRTQGVFTGAIWAALGHPPSREQVAAMQAAAPVVAQQLLADRRRADQRARERGDLIVELFGGGERSIRAAERAGLDQTLVVAAVRGTSAEAMESVAGALTLHLSVVAPQSVCAFDGATLYGVLRADGAVRILEDFLARVGASSGIVAGFGTPAAAVDLPHSRAVADDVARALLRRGRMGALATLEDVFSEVLVDRTRSFLTAHEGSSPLARLDRYDAAHLTELVPAVDAYLSASGNVLDAARALHVHPNTMRNRLRRCRDGAGVDPDDPGTRLSLMVHLAARRTG